MARGWCRRSEVATAVGMTAFVGMVLCFGFGGTNLEYVRTHPYSEGDVANAVAAGVAQCAADFCLRAATEGRCDEVAVQVLRQPYARVCSSYCGASGCDAAAALACVDGCTQAWANYWSVVHHASEAGTLRTWRGALLLVGGFACLCVAGLRAEPSTHGDGAVSEMSSVITITHCEN